MRDWSDYFQATIQKGPNPFYDQLEPFIPRHGHVLELGFGSGKGVGWWLDRGWRVDAVDGDQGMIEHLQEVYGSNPQLKITQSLFGDYQINGEYDVIAGVFSLFFTTGPEFSSIWSQIRSNLRSGDIFAGQLMGGQDDWANDPDTTWHTRAEVDELLNGLEILVLDEVERDGETVAKKSKHWHIFHIIARQP